MSIIITYIARVNLWNTVTIDANFESNPFHSYLSPRSIDFTFELIT